MNIYGKTVVLRAMEKEDCEMVRKMFNDPEMEKNVVGWSFPLSRQAQERWYENHIGDQNFRFVIETKEEGPVGIATLIDIDWKNRMAEHGIKLADNVKRGKGIGTDAVMALMRYAFDELQMNRLNGGRLVENIASGKLYHKCGWQDEGLRRQYAFKGGKYRDYIPMGILAEDYYRLIAENHYWE